MCVFGTLIYIYTSISLDDAWLMIIPKTKRDIEDVARCR